MSLSEADRAKILALATDLPQLWRATTTTAAERKQIVRLLVKEVVLDQRRERGQVWVRIVWQTGAVTEHRLQRQVRAYAEYADLERLEQRVRDLNSAGNMDHEIATILNSEGLATARGLPFSGEVVHLLRKRWEITTVKINGNGFNPARWPDGSYSVQGAVSPATVAIGTRCSSFAVWSAR